MIKPFFLLLPGLALCVLAASQADAHSMQETLSEIQQSEPYLQPVNRVAPDFKLDDAWRGDTRD